MVEMFIMVYRADDGLNEMFNVPESIGCDFGPFEALNNDFDHPVLNPFRWNVSECTPGVPGRP